MDQVVDYGLLTLLPPLVVIGMALLTKRTIEPLIPGSSIAAPLIIPMSISFRQ